MREIIVPTTAASGKRDGSIATGCRRGPEASACRRWRARSPGFFVMIFAGLAYPATRLTEGLRVMTITYPIKPPLYAITKSND